jgi:phosphoenolpyruvate synthase/pyruvate phosphate dikinase
VVARQLGKPCLVGCAQLAIDIAARSIALGGQTLHEGDSLWIDAEAGLVFAPRAGHVYRKTGRRTDKRGDLAQRANEGLRRARPKSSLGQV